MLMPVQVAQADARDAVTVEALREVQAENARLMEASPPRNARLPPYRHW